MHEENTISNKLEFINELLLKLEKRKENGNRLDIEMNNMTAQGGSVENIPEVKKLGEEYIDNFANDINEDDPEIKEKMLRTLSWIFEFKIDQVTMPNASG